MVCYFDLAAMWSMELFNDAYLLCIDSMDFPRVGRDPVEMFVFYSIVLFFNVLFYILALDEFSKNKKLFLS